MSSSIYGEISPLENQKCLWSVSCFRPRGWKQSSLYESPCRCRRQTLAVKQTILVGCHFIYFVASENQLHLLWQARSCHLRWRRKAFGEDAFGKIHTGTLTQARAFISVEVHHVITTLGTPGSWATSQTTFYWQEKPAQNTLPTCGVPSRLRHRGCCISDASKTLHREAISLREAIWSADTGDVRPLVARKALVAQWSFWQCHRTVQKWTHLQHLPLRTHIHPNLHQKSQGPVIIFLLTVVWYLAGRNACDLSVIEIEGLLRQKVSSKEHQLLLVTFQAFDRG